MGWQDLLQKPDETVTLPWVGGRELRTSDRVFDLVGKNPPEYGWHEFRIEGRRLRFLRPAPVPADPRFSTLRVGYLLGNRLIADDIRLELDPSKITSLLEQVHLIEPGLDRFSRISAGRVYEGGPLIFKGLEFPLGPESAVSEAYLSEATSTFGIPGVVPALDTAFRFETWYRTEAARIRLEEQQRLEREEAERLRRERLAEMARQVGTAVGRRALARTDFAQAARTALQVGGAEYLEHRAAYHQDEMVVRFRYANRRFECTCHAETLRVIDAGICLQDHDTGVKGDNLFTLESFPSVIQEAIDEGKLVVWRHV